jgi:serine/threonine-protein kinase
MSLVGRVFSDRYEIQREIAQGGMAEVFLGHDRLLDRPVAIKALFPEYAREPSFVERFRREAQAAANLNHPNIVGIYDWGQETGTYFIVMEYVEGRSLRDLIRSEGPLEGHQSAEICAEIASALAFAHRSGVVHRDVKPGNVLLTRAGSVKVTDFGIARAGTSDGLTQTGSVMGTATYFSPEQAQGLPVDGRSDVYALGVVLYEMVTGVAPFTGDSPVAVAYKHVREECVPPSRRNPDVPPELEQIILTALAKDPDHRYQTADDMRADLLRFRRGRPLAAAPVTAIVTELPTAATGAAAAAYAANAANATVQAPRVPPGGPPTGSHLPPPLPPRRNHALATVLVLLVLIILIGGVILMSQLAGGDSGKATVPDVVGMKVADATAELNRAGFDNVETTAVTSEAVAVDVVIDMNPRAKDRVSKSTTIKLNVSAGLGDIPVPDVTDQAADQAKQTLEDAGFKVDQRNEASDTVDPLHVIRTEPPADQKAASGSTVRMVVSTGREQVAIPDVTGLNGDEASATLSDADFVVVDASEASDTVPSGQVIRTDPAGGTKAPRGSRVKLVTSSGKAQVTVPDVRGKTQDAATSQLSGLGLQVSTLFQPSDPANAGKVIDQSVTPGNQVPPNSSILLTIGSSSSTTTSGSTTPTSGP